MLFERNDHGQATHELMATHELKISFQFAVLGFQFAEKFSVAVVGSG